MELATFENPGCDSDHLGQLKKVSEGNCHNMDNFLSYKAYPYKLSKHRMTDRGCELHVYADKDCVGREAVPYSIDGQTGACADTVFPDHLGNAPSSGRSVKVLCKSPRDAPKSKTKKVKTKYTSEVSVYAKPEMSKTHGTLYQTPSVISTASSLQPGSATTATAFSTVIVKPSSQSPTIPSVITIKTTTSIVVEPVVTTTAASTIWVPATTGVVTTRKPSISVYTVTYNRNEARATGMERREEAAQQEQAEAAEAACADAEPTEGDDDDNDDA